MGSKKIYKKVAVSFVTAGFLISGVGAAVSDQITNFTLLNDNITGSANSNTTIATFTANATTSISSLTLKFTTSDSSYISATRSLSTNTKLNVEITDSSGNIVTGGAIGAKNLSSSETSFIFALSGLTADATYSVKVNPATSGAEGRIHLTSVLDNSVAETFTTPNSIDLIIPPTLDAVTAQSSSSLRLSYSSTSSYSSSLHYLGYRGDSASQTTLINGGTYITSTSSFDDTGLSGSTTYYYKVCASRSDITSTNSYALVCSTANYGATSAVYVPSTTTTTTTSGVSISGGTVDETASTETTTVVTSEVVAVDDTTTSQSTTTIDETAGTAIIDMSLTDTTSGTSTIQTEVKMGAKVDVKVDETTGAITATETAETGDTNAVTVSKNGDTALQTTTKDKSTLKINLPAGKEGVKAKTESNNGKSQASTKLESSKTTKEITVTVTVDPGTKGAKATVTKDAFPQDVIDKVTGGGTNVNVVVVTGAPSNAGVVSSETDVIMSDGTERALREASIIRAFGLKTTFKSTRGFFAAKKEASRETDYSEAKTVEIFPTTSWQKFEEVLLFDGKRSIKLLMGGADIIVNGERSAMVQNEEYILPLQIETVDGTTIEPTPEPTTSPVYSNGKLSLTAGWNLIALPVNTTVDDMSIFGDYSGVWAYASGAWSNPTTVSKAQGFWINMNSANEVAFSGDIYEPIVADLDTGWSLVGTGNELTNFKSINSLEAVWTHQNGWISDPETIYAGQGFWMKK